MENARLTDLGISDLHNETRLPCHIFSKHNRFKFFGVQRQIARRVASREWCVIHVVFVLKHTDSAHDARVKLAE